MTTKNDLLYQAALEYKKFIGTKIEFLVGRKGESKLLTVIFKPSDFHHLAGLHKLSDIQKVYKGKAEDIFNQILSKKICVTDIENSVFFKNITERLEIISQLTYIFSNKSTIFEFRKVQVPGSKICWKYLLEFKTISNMTGYLFINEYRINPGNYVCVTDFFKNKADYGLKQIRLTLLKTDLINQEGARCVLFVSSSYKP
ncbi:PBECR4 domain-containing protein [Pediococcus pentosaceus]|uniref:PBECR4 domain-containing protein n=1 Tax=Pediococcus pentosaceus TaxID=1255 RepID=UPI00211C7164|nr:PBECR4 domain-containing protein [Pediococcus pentosaceus]MCQ9316970.1 PBECR4 domain-containing protein [Pediococcus pentosaceus]MCQ9339511.1 PBECR4 domain-containing protein [Pediococcus pentosaceus]